MAATVPFDMLAEIQGCAASGGLVQSALRAGDRLEPGDLIRHNGAWAVITAWSVATSYNLNREIVDQSPAITWRDADGAADAKILFGCAGREVRTDTRIDPATIPAP